MLRTADSTSDSSNQCTPAWPLKASLNGTLQDCSLSCRLVPARLKKCMTCQSCVPRYTGARPSM